MKVKAYPNVDSMFVAILHELLSHGDIEDSRDGGTLEMIGWAGKLLHSERNFLSNERRALSPSYASAETLWYLGGDKRTEMIERYAPQYSRFAVNGRAYGAYGPRIVPQLPKIVECLKQSPQSRQAVLPIWAPRDLDQVVKGGSPDIPCTCSLHFFVRNKKLELVTYMRSNDAWLGFPYDVFAFTCVQRLVAAHLDVQPGPYTHMVGSMHLYDRNREAAEEAAKKYAPTGRHWWKLDDTFTTMRTAVAAEYAMRRSEPCSHTWWTGLDLLGTMLHDLVTCCACKLRPGVSLDEIKSPALKEGAKRERERVERRLREADRHGADLERTDQETDA